MKTIIITSQLTYVPGNCQSFFDELFERDDTSVVGAVLVKNVSFSILVKILWLYSTGCYRIANTLVSNIFQLPLQRQEKIFKKYNIPVKKVNSINDIQIVNWVKQKEVDLVVNFRARCLFSKELLNAPRLGCINMHHGLLPKYRGLYCDLYALYENRPAGFTLHKMNEKLDDGEIFSTTQASNKGEKKYCEYLHKLGVIEAEILAKFLNLVKINNSFPTGTPNIDGSYVYTKMPNRRLLSKMKAGGMIL